MANGGSLQSHEFREAVCLASAKLCLLQDLISRQAANPCRTHMFHALVTVADRCLSCWVTKLYVWQLAEVGPSCVAYVLLDPRPTSTYVASIPPMTQARLRSLHVHVPAPRLLRQDLNMYSSADSSLRGTGGSVFAWQHCHG